MTLDEEDVKFIVFMIICSMRTIWHTLYEECPVEDMPHEIDVFPEKLTKNLDFFIDNTNSMNIIGKILKDLEHLKN